MALHDHDTDVGALDELDVRPQVWAGRVPKLRLAEGGIPPASAYQIVHDELMLDGNARLNLATFVTTWMEPEAATLMAECADKNMIDKDEYPQTAELERRCVNMLAALWHASRDEQATGCSTTGSSEACMLGGLALKHRWRNRRRSAGQDTASPNLVMGANVQVCWEKFCRYFDVEPRLVPVGPDTTHLTPAAAAAHCDDHTIGVVAVLGSTYDGAYENVAGIAAELDALQAATAVDVPIHVDGASGAMIAPFLDPDLDWDFRIPRVQSINCSGHKYGLVYPGVGWIVWRDHAALPDELIFNVDYLGGTMPTFGLNFSRPGAQVVAQYYSFLRLGLDGYRRVHQASRDTARWLADRVEQLGPFRLISRGDGIPAFAFTATPEVNLDVYDVSEHLRTRGWIVPAYKLPPALDTTSVLRIVVRNGFSRDLAAILLTDLTTTIDRLTHRPGPPDRTGFHH